MATQEKKSTPSAGAANLPPLAQQVQQLGDEFQTSTKQVQQFLKQQVKEHPYRSVLVAFGAGYVLAGGLASAMTRQIIRLGLRSAAPSLIAAALAGAGFAGEGDDRSTHKGE
jgi:hypothetical protein